DRIVEGGSANIGKKGKNAERAEGPGELESLTRTREPVVETKDHSNFSKERKEVMEDDRFINETRVQLATNDTCD
ncbi:hypothetical protein MKX03_001168, partial [Papaver bracteatum]